MAVWADQALAGGQLPPWYVAAIVCVIAIGKKLPECSALVSSSCGTN
jgi:hypothetical protein